MDCFNNKYAIIILVMAFLCIAIPRVIFPDLDHGDEFTDANILAAGENFTRLGFVDCKFVPFFDLHCDKLTQSYTHFPSLPEIINGILRVLFKTDSLLFFRIVSLLFSLFGVLLWYFFIEKLTGSFKIAFLAGIFYLTNPLFIYGFDSLGEPSYSEFLRTLIFFVFLIFLYSPKEKKSKFLFSLWILYFISSLVTFEYIPYLFLFAVLFKYSYSHFRNNIPNKIFLILFLAPVCGFLLHFARNSWHFGSFSLALEDLRSIVFGRTIGGYELPHGLSFLLWVKYAILRNFSLVFYFRTSLIFLSAFFVIILYLKLSAETKSKIRELFYLFIILTICGISWYVFFPSHSVAHAFVNFLARHLLPVASVSFALFSYTLFSFIKEKMNHNTLAKILGILIVIAIVFAGIVKSELPVTPNNILRAQEFTKFKHCLLQLRDQTKKEDIIGVNYHRSPFIRYYTNRNCSNIFDVGTLKEIGELPDVFILMLYDSKQTKELFDYLNENYSIVMQCNSRLFPSLIFKRNENISN